MWVDLDLNKTEKDKVQDPPLSQLWAEVWNGLKISLVRRGDPWRTPCLCTVGADGANGRIVVLRRVLIDSHEIRFHTDQRSLKVNEFETYHTSHQKVTCLFYSPRWKRQVRFKGIISELIGDERKEEWQKTSPQSREIYGLESAPKTPQSSSESGWYFNEQMAFEHFKAYRIKATHLDVLTLRPEGHERALFQLKESALELRSSSHHWQGMWVTP